MESSNKQGHVPGCIYTTYNQDVQKRKKLAKFNSVENLLLELINTTKPESKAQKAGKASRFYEELTKIYRKQKDYKKETDLLKRFTKQQHALGITQEKLLESLEKAKILA